MPAADHLNPNQMNRRDSAVHTVNALNQGAGGLSSIDSALKENSSAITAAKTGKTMEQRINGVLDSAAPAMIHSQYTQAAQESGLAVWEHRNAVDPPRDFMPYRSRASNVRTWGPHRRDMGTFVQDHIADTRNNEEAMRYQHSMGISIDLPNQGGKSREITPDQAEWHHDGVQFGQNEHPGWYHE